MSAWQFRNFGAVYVLLKLLASLWVIYFSLRKAVVFSERLLLGRWGPLGTTLVKQNTLTKDQW